MASRNCCHRGGHRVSFLLSLQHYAVCTQHLLPGFFCRKRGPPSPNTRSAWNSTRSIPASVIVPRDSRTPIRASPSWISTGRPRKCWALALLTELFHVPADSRSEARRRPFASLLETLPGVSLRRTALGPGRRLHRVRDDGLPLPLRRKTAKRKPIQIGWSLGCALCQNGGIEWLSPASRLIAWSVLA